MSLRLPTDSHLAQAGQRTSPAVFRKIPKKWVCLRGDRKGPRVSASLNLGGLFLRALNEKHRRDRWLKLMAQRKLRVQSTGFLGKNLNKGTLKFWTLSLHKEIYATSCDICPE